MTHRSAKWESGSSSDQTSDPALIMLCSKGVQLVH